MSIPYLQLTAVLYSALIYTVCNLALAYIVASQHYSPVFSFIYQYCVEIIVHSVKIENVTISTDILIFCIILFVYAFT